MDDGVLLRVPPELAFLLPARDRGARARRTGFDPDATVGHLIRAAGVPLTEVGTLLLDGRPVPDTARPSPGSTLDVSAAARPQVVPPCRFLLDVELGALAHRGLLERRVLGRDGGALVRGARPDEQPADVLDRFALDVRPSTRCTSCARVYWRGAHARRIDALVAAARDRSRVGGHNRRSRQGSASALRVRDTADPRT